MAIDVQAALVKQRMDILEQLADLAVKDRPPHAIEMYRSEGKSLLKALEDTERAISALGSTQAMQLTSCESAIDAIEMLLESAKRPMTRREIIERVVEGGLWAGKNGTGLRVQKSLTVHLKDSRMSGRIKEVNGLVGLFDWGAHRF